MVYESGTTIPNQPSPVEVTISAPDKATAGSTFDIFMDIKPGMQNGPVELPANSISGIYTSILVGDGGSPDLLETTHPAYGPVVPANGSIPVPQHVAQVTATGAVGDTISYKPGTVITSTVTVPGTALTSPGAVTCDATVEDFGSTEIVEEELADPTGPPPTAPPASTTTTTTAAPAGDSGTTTTAAPIAPASSGPQAQVLEQSAQVDFVCTISVGPNPLPDQDDPQTVTIKTVDKVAPGGNLAFQVTLDPGPRTGPVALPNGVEDFKLNVAAGGAGSPSDVVVSVGNVPGRVETNSSIKVPTASGSVTAAGADGDQVTLTVKSMSFATSSPQSTTNCVAANPPVITTTQIVEGVEVAAETAEQLAFTGNSRGWLLPFAALQLILGLGLVAFAARNRRTRSSWSYVRF